jgi:hypothetical protein
MRRRAAFHPKMIVYQTNDVRAIGPKAHLPPFGLILVDAIGG